ncbi:hypothetical protein KXQ82_05700 [Mucilaginibacter sp. HMF5004]|uniref:hypothetical protein n=1 Tax=Mucilaginibacter rivuli TaxID=2857527 RepID=UPI001C5D0B03|nr:hypothetical protein [Mucilaginibacter rivuli]MBW4889197.1 hypothetical protein [Mucilaginibacter rivuli]
MKNILKDDEGKTSTGRYYAHKSESIWKAKRIEKGEFLFVISKVIGEHGDWRIYYRTLTNYDNSAVQGVRVFGDYQQIDSYLFANAFFAMGETLPPDVGNEIKLSAYSDDYSTRDNICGELFLHSFITKHHPELDIYLVNDFYDPISKEEKLRHELPGISNNKKIEFDKIKAIAETQVEEFIVDYLAYVECTFMTEIGFTYWHPNVRRTKWQNSLDNFSETYIDYWKINQVHVWDFKFDLLDRCSASSQVKLFFIADMFIDSRHNIRAAFDIDNPPIVVNEEDLDNLYTSLEQVGTLETKWIKYAKHYTKPVNYLLDVHLLYCDDRWYLKEINPLKVNK